MEIMTVVFSLLCQWASHMHPEDLALKALINRPKISRIGTPMEQMNSKTAALQG
jgi:hypothetical protein